MICINKIGDTMTTPYTYFLFNKITGEKYYGVRYAKDCTPSELWCTYFSSSKYVKQLIKEHGKYSFEFQVRKTFTTPSEARTWEERVLRKLNILNNNTWLNKNVCGKFLKEGPQSIEHKEKRLSKIRGSNHPFYGKPKSNPFYSKQHSEETLKKLRKPKSNTSNMTFNLNNFTKVSCPHCGKEGQLTNMKRWHFDNCNLQSQSD
jgi:hypothetical protein